MQQLHLPLVSSVLITMASSLMAQSVSPALAEAQRRLVCGTGTPVSANYLPTGQLRVTCRRPIAGNNAGVLQGTGLAGGPALGAIAAAFVLVVVAGDDENGTTTTTTTTGN